MASAGVALLAATGVIVFAGTVVRSVSGLGFSLVAVPLLTLAWPPQQAVALAVLFQTLGTLPLVASQRAHIDWPTLRSVCTGAIAGIVPGLALLQCLSDTALRLLLTALLLLSIGLIAAGRRLVSTMTPGRLRCAGVCAGFGQGLAGVPGPPLMAGLLAMPNLGSRAVRATATAAFLCLGSVSLAGLALHGTLAALPLPALAVAALGMMCGHKVGEYVFARVGGNAFRRLVLLVLLVSALLTLAPAWVR